MPHLIAPTGAEIIGTSEVVPGVAGIDWTSLKRAANGDLEFRHDSAGTDINWNEQQTKTGLGGELVFVDEHGHEWLGRELTLEA